MTELTPPPAHSAWWGFLLTHTSVKFMKDIIKNITDLSNAELEVVCSVANALRIKSESVGKPVNAECESPRPKKSGPFHSPSKVPENGVFVTVSAAEFFNPIRSAVLKGAALQKHFRTRPFYLLELNKLTRKFELSVFSEVHRDPCLNRPCIERVAREVTEKYHTHYAELLPYLWTFERNEEGDGIIIPLSDVMIPEEEPERPRVLCLPEIVVAVGRDSEGGLDALSADCFPSNEALFYARFSNEAERFRIVPGTWSPEPCKTVVDFLDRLSENYVNCPARLFRESGLPYGEEELRRRWHETLKPSEDHIRHGLYDITVAVGKDNSGNWRVISAHRFPSPDALAYLTYSRCHGEFCVIKTIGRTTVDQMTKDGLLQDLTKQYSEHPSFFFAMYGLPRNILPVLERIDEIRGTETATKKAAKKRPDCPKKKAATKKVAKKRPGRPRKTSS